MYLCVCGLCSSLRTQRLTPVSNSRHRSGRLYNNSVATLHFPHFFPFSHSISGAFVYLN